MLFTKLENGIEYHNGGETIRIIPWGANSFRVVCRPQGKLDMGSIGLLEPQPQICEIQIEDSRALITNGNITAELDTRGWNSSAVIRFYNSKGKLLLGEIDGGGALLRKAHNFKSHIGGKYSLKVTFESEASEKIFGMGQYQQDEMNLKGCNLELAHRNSQVSIPFYISSLGYGFLWHNAAIGEVSFGKNNTVWKAEYTEQMDYWITSAETPAEIMAAYTQATGKVPMMPEAGLGFWQCKLRYYNQEDVIKTAEEYHRRNIPVDVFVIDYYHWPRCGDYRFDEEFFPEPEAMIKRLKEMGMETMVSIWPQVDWRSENFNEMYQKGLLVKTEHGLNIQMNFQGNNVFYDATNPETNEYVWEKCKKNYWDYGIKTFWLDEAEPEFGTYDYDNYRYFIGPVTEKGNVYPREYAKGFFEGQKKAGQNEIMNLIRCAWVGSQRYGTIVWSGDIHSTFKDLRNQISAGLQMGLVGIPWWTTDIGGFHGGNITEESFKELLIRWFQFGTFCPVMRMHGNRLPRKTIYKNNGEETEGTGADNEIWSYGEEAYQIMRHYIEVREAMRDYSRLLMKQAHEQGSPVMRTLFYEFPEDERCWEVSATYLYGSDILVAPVIEAETIRREVYLPKGAQWTHTLTGKIYKGGQQVVVDAPLDSIPIFLRDGRQDYLMNLFKKV